MNRFQDLLSNLSCAATVGGGGVGRLRRPPLGRPVHQVEPIKPLLKAPGRVLLKLRYDELLSSLAFKFNLHHYSWGPAGTSAVGSYFALLWNSVGPGRYRSPCHMMPLWLFRFKG
jgi:hypothetical protein